MKIREGIEPAKAERVLSAEEREKLREELGRMYKTDLLRFCYYLTSPDMPNRREAAAVLAQETMVRALESLHTYDGRNLKSWLFAIAHNKVIDIFRRQHGSMYRDRNPLHNGSLDDADFIDPQSLRPEHRLDDKRNEALVEEALKIFSKRHQEIWRLKREEYGPKEIALMKGMNEETVKVILFRMRKRLPGIIKRLQQQKASKRKNK